MFSLLSNELTWREMDYRSAFIKIQDKQRLFSVHFIRNRKHVYLFVIDFFTVMSFKHVNQFSREAIYIVVQTILCRKGSLDDC